MAVRKIDWNQMQQQIEDAEKKKTTSASDNDQLAIKLNKEGKFNALVRFLPNHLDDTLPYTKIMSHSFQVGNRWFIEPCLKTIGQKCPVCEKYWSLYDKNLERQPEDVSRFKNKTNYWYNVYVIRNNEDPESEGTIKKFRAGVKIHGKIMNKIKPEDPADPSVNVFDYENGCNFKLNVRKVSGQNNYDQCEFSERSRISHKDGTTLTDSQIEKIDTKLFKLSDEIDIKKFKSYEELEKKMYTILGESSQETKKSSSKIDKLEKSQDEAPRTQRKTESPAPKIEQPEREERNDLDENPDDFFAQLVNGD